MTTRCMLSVASTAEEGPFALEEGEKIKLHIGVDKSIVEVFANDPQAIMRRIYPTLEESLGVTLFCEGDSVQVHHLDAWQMWPSNPY